MARVYAYETHTYEHRQQKAPTRAFYVFPRGEVRDVPAGVAEIVCTAHPTKLKFLAEFEEPPNGMTIIPAVNHTVDSPPEIHPAEKDNPVPEKRRGRPRKK